MEDSTINEKNRRDESKDLQHGSTGQGNWLYAPQFPEDWIGCSLHSLAEWVNGVAFRKIQFNDVGKPVIKIAEIKNGLTTQTKYTLDEFDESVHVQSGDLLFSWSGQPETSIGAFWWRGPDGWLNQHIFRVSPAPGVDIVFFYYLLKYLNPNFVGIARNKQTTGLGHVTKRDLKSIEVSVPPLPDQRAFGRILGTLDDKIELNHQRIKIMEEMASALFQSWFVDFDGFDSTVEGRHPDTL
ncbi:MAG: restriction endonuclease subunit S, partial [bacterium]|nr:restriction endonuclease subunit S [bacterium]